VRCAWITAGLQLTRPNGPGLTGLTAVVSPRAAGLQHTAQAFRCHDMRATAPKTTLTAGQSMQIEWYLQARKKSAPSLHTSRGDPCRKAWS